MQLGKWLILGEASSWRAIQQVSAARLIVPPALKSRTPPGTWLTLHGTVHGKHLHKAVERVVSSLPAHGAVAVEMDCGQVLALLRHSGFRGHAPLPPVAFDDGVVSDHCLEARMAFQDFFMDATAEIKVCEESSEFVVAARAAKARGLPFWLLDLPRQVLAMH